VKEVTNSPDVSEEVTKSSVVVANCDDIGESIANSVDAVRLGLVILPRTQSAIQRVQREDGLIWLLRILVQLKPRSFYSIQPATLQDDQRRRKQQKKAKARKEIQETKTLSKQLTTVGDITLTTLREYVDQKKLSLASIDPLQVETNIRYVIPEVLVDKSVAAAKNAVFREQTASKRTPTLGEIGVHILGVGVISLQDVNTMKEWHTFSKRIKSTRDLIKWVQSKPENGVQQSILSTLPTLNMYSAFKSRIAETIVQFQDLTRFAGENWLCDGCIFVAALHAVKQAQPIGKNRGGVTEVLVVDSVFLGFELEVDRKRLIDTDKHILNKGYNGRIVFFPCSIWIYDPKQKLDYIDEVERIMKSYVVKLIDPAFKGCRKMDTTAVFSL
ncbi:hypothetical protein GN958_ATG14028, partial [Phytophthora infestans]